MENRIRDPPACSWILLVSENKAKTTGFDKETLLCWTWMYEYVEIRA
jgi:hypothetical protein